KRPSRHQRYKHVRAPVFQCGRYRREDRTCAQHYTTAGALSIPAQPVQYRFLQRNGGGVLGEGKIRFSETKTYYRGAAEIPSEPGQHKAGGGDRRKRIRERGATGNLQQVACAPSAA